MNDSKTTDLSGSKVNSNLIFEQVYKEVDFLRKLKSCYTVDYENCWFDADHLYIQMELCCGDLKSLIEKKSTTFHRKSGKEMCLIEYFISAEIFIELIECLGYLHGQSIIHRDIKPANILYTLSGGKRFFKLGDLGLAKYHDLTKSMYDNTAGVGTTKYMAYEVHTGNYNSKADIFSLGVTAAELFDFPLFRYVQLEQKC